MNLPVPGMVIPGPNGNNTVCLEHSIGMGAFGVVFLATDSTDGTKYAVKFPQHTIFGGSPDMRGFLNEVTAAKEIQHPNVVRVLHTEVNLPEIPPFLLMEFLPGGTLKDRIDEIRSKGENTSLALVRQLTESLIDGMEAINAKMLHRDLKPDNILLDGNTPKIGDFGLSKLIGAATRSNTFKGGQHFLYMAPEGWKCDKNEIQIDMYALGIVLYEIAALRYPYKLPTDSRDIVAVQDMHLFQQPAPLSGIRPDLPTPFCQIVARLMEKRAQNRFSTWQDVRNATGRAFGSQTTAVAPQAINALVSMVGQLHEVHTRRRLEEESRENDELRWQQLNDYQAEKLIEELRAAVEAFNQSSPLAQIRFSKHGPQRFEFLLPFGAGPLRVGFFEVKPALKLKRGNVGFAALATDIDSGGMNFLLCRSGDSDLYGQWVPLRVRVSGLVDPRRCPPRAEPFGFSQGQMKDVELADRAMHIFGLDYPVGAIGEVFLQVAQATIERRGNPSGRPSA